MIQTNEKVKDGAWGGGGTELREWEIINIGEVTADGYSSGVPVTVIGPKGKTRIVQVEPAEAHGLNAGATLPTHLQPETSE